ncbi:MAG TPA: glycosyltransferase [Chitinophagaceae bacterium]|nr:glycosyltransferase [Chitinophagaceae bacterium]
MPKGISVVICCFNSSARITPTLQHLVRQKGIPSSCWEVILVDNASTDNTAEKARVIWDGFKFEKPVFRVVEELKPGHSAARSMGIRESQYDYVLFCDDDNWLDENYLDVCLDIMKGSAFIGALGGTGTPVFEDKEPPYFWVNQYHTLAVGRQSSIEGDITDSRGVLYGAGMIVNKLALNTLMEQFEFRFLVSGRTKGNLISSDDHELCLALKKIGYKIFYSDNLQFKHYIPKFRTTIEYYKRLFFAFGISEALLHVYMVTPQNLHYLKNDYRYICLRCLKNIFILQIHLIFGGYYFGSDKYRFVGQLHLLFNNKGKLVTFLKVKNRYKHQYLTLPLFALKS